jgi:hypothetical protein
MANAWLDLAHQSDKNELTRPACETPQPRTHVAQRQQQQQQQQQQQPQPQPQPKDKAERPTKH